jgi:hypothetical protein
MRAAFFHFQMEETDAAIRCSAKVLKTVPNYDGVIFNYYDRLVPGVGRYCRTWGTTGARDRPTFATSWERRRRAGSKSVGVAAGAEVCR